MPSSNLSTLATTPADRPAGEGNPRAGRIARVLLGVILVLDVVAVGGDLLVRSEQWSGGVLYLLDMEGGNPKFYQLLKLCAVTALLTRLAWRTAQPLPAGWAIFFGLLLADYAIRLREWGAWHVMRTFGVGHWLGLNPMTAAELLLLAVVGGGMLLVGWRLYRMAPAAERAFSRRLAWAVAVLLSFALGVDALYDLFKDELVRDVLTVVEDAGELLTVTWIVWMTVRVEERWRT